MFQARAGTWLGEGSSAVQQQALRDLDRAFRNWWSNPAHFGRPSWRVKGRHEGFRIVGPQAQRFERLSRKRARVLIPKVGWVDWRWSRDPGDVKSYRIKHDPTGRWWISFATVPAPVAGPDDESVIGIDVGIAASVTASDGTTTCWPTLTRSETARLRRLHHKLARQSKGSKRRDRTKEAIARLEHRRINRRNDAIEKYTTDIAARFDWIAVEDLKIGNMVRSAGGTIEEPGTNVAQKRGLNREIQHQAWGRLRQRLTDKAPNRVVRVDPTNTSRRCNPCGHIAVENRKSQAVFECVNCAHRDNADINAAKNIAAGWAVTARGADGLPTATKREPLAA